ncbi:MAG: PDZ domain-containing protein, partial [Verrucomicrobiota bacterium]
LFDLEGKLIGIHSSISVSLAQNMHVALDAFEGEDRKRMEADETWGELSQAAVFNEDDAPQNPRSRQPNAAKRGRAVLGAVLERRSRNGVLIKRLPDSSPAKAGGAREGDVIIGFEGKEIATYPELTESVSEKSPGDKVSIKVRRGDEQIDLEIELGDRSRVR